MSCYLVFYIINLQSWQRIYDFMKKKVTYGIHKVKLLIQILKLSRSKNEKQKAKNRKDTYYEANIIILMPNS